MYQDRRERWVAVAPERAFVPILRIGGSQGWYYANFLWKLRGWLDLLIGGPGLRGRLEPETLQDGDPLDWWRVERIEPNRLLRLRAEMKVPGTAWLEFRVEPEGSGSRIIQTATYDPAGIGGKLYWWLMWPFHQVLFPGMLRTIAREAAR